MKQKSTSPIYAQTSAIPWTIEDVPPVCWVRSTDVDTTPSIVMAIDPRRGVLVAYYGWVPFQCLASWQYSSDLKTWLPARK